MSLDLHAWLTASWGSAECRACFWSGVLLAGSLSAFTSLPYIMGRLEMLPSQRVGETSTPMWFRLWQ